MNTTDVSSLKLSDIMTPNPITLAPEDNILEKGHVFKENKTKERFSYNKETLLNSGFLCLGFNPW